MSARMRSSPRCAATSAGTSSPTRRCRTSSTHLPSRAAATFPPGRRNGCRPPASTRCGRGSPSPTTERSRRSRCCRRRRTTTRRSGRIACASASTTAPTRASSGRSRWSSTPTSAGTSVTALVGVRRPDLVLVNDDDLAYTKIRLDDDSLRLLVEHIGEFRETLPRALCWTAAWDMTRDGEMAAGDFLELVLGGITQETDIGTVQNLLRLARSAADPYGDPARREERIVRLADRALELMHAAEPGSDTQLAFARSLAANATTDEQLSLVADLLCGAQTVEGLAVDTELRWTLLNRLVVMGRAGETEIDAELARDNTAAGKRHSMALRAARPTPEAKEEAWQLAVEDDTLPNAEQAAVIGGFQQQEHRKLLAPYSDRYFEVVAEAWEQRTSEMAQQIAIGLYPALCVSQDTIDRTDTYLRTAQPVPSLRRLITENRDNVARAPRAQQRDQQP